MRRERNLTMSKHKYGMQKNVQNDLQQCINSFERMKRGGIGIADELVCDTCKRALKYIDELEEKLADVVPVRHGHWYNRGGRFRCSVCDNKALLKDIGGTGGWSHEYEQQKSPYCPNCGASMTNSR